jgi:3-oxoacyl-[acyl-carrier-protein] synthase II
MNRAPPAVLVTGIGLITSLGVGAAANWARLKAGHSGARTIRHFSTDNLPTTFAAYVDEPCVTGCNTPERTLSMARLATAEAFEDAGLDGYELPPARSRLFISTPHPEAYLLDRLAVRRADEAARPDAALRLFNSVQAAEPGQALKREFGIGGVPINVTTACASSASALQLAAEAILRGDIDIAVVAAADASVYPEGMIHLSLLSALSTRNEEPARASRPFTLSRDGFVMGEGGVAFILESRAHALGRHAATIHGALIGAGDVTDNFHRTRSHPSGRSIVSCMSRAMENAGLALGEVDYINAHGTSTPENDRMESLGIRELFGPASQQPPISSNKSMIGHTLCAAGAIEAAFTLASLNDGLLPPSINCEDPDEDLGVNLIANEGLRRTARVALSNSFGFGGQNVTLALAGAAVV